MSALAEYGITPVYTGQESHRLTTGGRVVALSGQHARLFSLNITTAATGTTVYIYDGVSTNGTLVAQVDASSKGSFVFGGVRCPNGIFANVLGGTIEATLGYEGSVRDGVVTLSGNEIRDTTRALNTQGDGVTAPDSSMGIWEATTNLVTNGGFETNTTGWSAVIGAETLTRVTSHNKFGSAALQVDVLGLASLEGVKVSATVASGSVYTFSAWLSGSGTVTLNFLGSTSSAITLTTTPTRYTLTATAGSSGALNATIITNSTQTTTFYVDGVQVELKPIATPYVETDGGTASRLAARVRAPSSLNATQGWFAIRFRAGFSNTNTTAQRMASWADDGNNRIELLYDNSGLFRMFRQLGGAGNSANSGSQTFVTGDSLTVIGAWTATLLKVSPGGAAFISAANTSIPSILNSIFDIGRYSPSADSWINSDVFWFACGTGTLTDNDAVGINAMGSNDPQFSNFPAAAAATMIWHANTSQYLVP